MEVNLEDNLINKAVSEVAEKQDGEKFEEKFQEKYGMTLEEAVSQRFMRDNAPRIRDVYQYSRAHKLTIEQVREEIKEKKSGLSAMNRRFAAAFKADVIEKWIDELFGKHESKTTQVAS